MSHSYDRIIDQLDPRAWGQKESHWIRTAVSTITMAAAVGAAGLAVWRYLQDNPDLFKSDGAAADDDAAEFGGPTAPDVPPPYGTA